MVAIRGFCRGGLGAVDKGEDQDRPKVWRVREMTKARHQRPVSQARQDARGGECIQPTGGGSSSGESRLPSAAPNVDLAGLNPAIANGSNNFEIH